MFNRWLKLPDYNALILGARRAGKSTFLKQNYPDYQYQTLDDLDLLMMAHKDPKGLIQSLGNKFIIDEIQRAPELTIAVKYAIDQYQAKVILTGSSSIGLLDSAADTLAGRIDIIHMPTCCWGEEKGEATHKIFDDKCSIKQIQEANRELSLALNYGGFPEVVDSSNEESKKIILKRYKDTYFTRDLLQIANIENLPALMAIYQHLSQSICSNIEVSTFAGKAGISNPTAKKYLNALHQSDLTLNLTGYQFGPAKRFIKSPKVYFADNGLLNTIGLQVNKGQLIENFIISEIEKRRKLGYYRCENLQYYRTQNGNEVDLIIEEPDLIRAIEIKSTNKLQKRDFSNLHVFESNIKKEIRKYLFYTGDDYQQVGEIKILPISSIYRGI